MIPILADIFSPDPAVIMVIVLLVIGIIVWRLFFRGQRRGYTATRLLTNAESEFYRKILPLCPSGTVLWAKVRLADLVAIPTGLTGKEKWRVFAPIAQKHVDFVLYNPAANQVVKVIELNDSTHHAMERRQRDIFIKDVLESAGIRLTFVPLKRNYSHDELVNIFR